MIVPRRFLLAALAAAALTSLAAAAPAKPASKTAPPESKSTTAQPVAPGASATPAPPEPPDDDDDDNGRVDTSVGGDVTVKTGETHEGDITRIRAHVVIDGHVTGNVTVVMGKLDVSGSIDGTVASILTEARLHPGSKIGGEMVNIGGSLDRSSAKIRRDVVNIPLGLNFGSWGNWNHLGEGLEGFLFLWKLFCLFLFFVCALLLSALVPDRIRRISEETPAKLVVAFFFGLMGYVALGITQIFLCVTLIGIPVAMILYVIFVVLKWMAMAGVFHHVGLKIGRSLGREMSLLGAFVLGFLPFALLRLIPFCIGYFIWFGVEILAFGLLLAIYVFHGSRRPPAMVPAPAIVAPAPPPPSPTMS